MYTIDENELNFMEKSAFDDDEIYQDSSPHDKAKDAEVEVGEVTKGITLGHKDKR